MNTRPHYAVLERDLPFSSPTLAGPASLVYIITPDSVSSPERISRFEREERGSIPLQSANPRFKMAYNRTELPVSGWMCMIDWQHELGNAAGGTKVYASIEDLKKEHDCWAECGIVEVEVRFVKEVAPQNL
jgi:hypothetical protein